MLKKIRDLNTLYGEAFGSAHPGKKVVGRQEDIRRISALIKEPGADRYMSAATYFGIQFHIAETIKEDLAFSTLTHLVHTYEKRQGLL